MVKCVRSHSTRAGIDPGRLRGLECPACTRYSAYACRVWYRRGRRRCSPATPYTGAHAGGYLRIRDAGRRTMALIIWLQALEPHALWRCVFAMLSWCGDGPLYVLLFPLLYWRKAPAIAIRYGYVVGLAVLLLTV